jgi:hypothetical protein
LKMRDLPPQKEVGSILYSVTHPLYNGDRHARKKRIKGASMKRLLCVLALLPVFCFVASHTLVAEDGVTATTILIGNEKETGGFSGDEENLGFALSVKEANERGGIHGRTLQILGYARKGGAAEGVANAKRLVEVDDEARRPDERDERAAERRS